MNLMRGISDVEMIDDKDCSSCHEPGLEETCPGGLRSCKHHCNHWADGSACHWCNSPEADEE